MRGDGMVRQVGASGRPSPPPKDLGDARGVPMGFQRQTAKSKLGHDRRVDAI
jgi:hypothetical protein